jgi:hypothetical protein
MDGRVGGVGVLGAARTVCGLAKLAGVKVRLAPPVTVRSVSPLPAVG